MVVDPELMVAAFIRGTEVDRDLCSDWDWWDDMASPIGELREKYNILPH